jgi:hypothetical protein
MSLAISHHPRHLFKLAFVVALASISLLQAPACAALDTLRVGTKVLVVDDPIPRVLDLMGKPLYVSPLVDSFGVYQGDQWFYKLDNSDVTLLILNGQVMQIDERVER